MQVSRRRFLGAASGASTLGALAAHGRAQAGAALDADPLGVRDDFPGAGELAYLNTAYIGLIPRPVLDAGRAWLDRRAHRPYDVGEMIARSDDARRGFARLINASDEEIGLLFSTSEGENVVTDALEFRRGDNVVLDDLAYPSTTVIHKRIEETKGIEVRFVRQRAGEPRVEDFARAVAHGRLRRRALLRATRTA